VSPPQETFPKIRAFILSQTPHDALRLKSRLQPYPFIHLVGQLHHPAHAVDTIKLHQPDVLFIDAKLTGTSGPEVVETLRLVGLNPQIILLATNSEAALEAFELGALDYLIKLPTRQRLHLAIKRLVERLDPAPNTNATTTPPGLIVKSASQFHLVPFSEIHAITASHKLTEIWTTNASYLSDESLDHLATKLPKGEYFRTHRSSLCRLESIQTLTTKGKGNYQLSLKHESSPTIPVARRRYRQLLDQLSA